MEKHAMVLDCTLRDGAYLVDKEFGDETINGVIQGLVDAGVDIIEIGFLQDDGFGKGKTVFLNSEDAKKHLLIQRKKIEFAVMADFSRYSIDNLDVCNGESFTIVRECFFKHERFEALKVCKKIKELGYKLFVQPVDILGYTDNELLEFIAMVNDIQPYAFSIVDTFGSMYMEDLERVFSLIDHNLSKDCVIGFHSHNNLQMSGALSQDFLKISFGKRKVVVDTTVYGMGRGAGNTPTELVLEYMNKHMGYHYDIDNVLDIIDNYFGAILSKCSWGYTIPMFIAGSNSAHVNNVTYLTEKNSIQSKDIRFILNSLDKGVRKRYDYDLLQEKYIQRTTTKYDDKDVIEELKTKLNNKDVVIICPGNTVKVYEKDILSYIKKTNALVIAVNFIPEGIPSDYLYFSNIKRFNYWKQNENFTTFPKIITSNITHDNTVLENRYLVSFEQLVKCGWNYMDNSVILLLRLLDKLCVNKIALAGLDGFTTNSLNDKNYCQNQMELLHTDVQQLNQDIMQMLVDYQETRHNNVEVSFLTPSRFSHLFTRR